MISVHALAPPLCSHSKLALSLLFDLHSHSPSGRDQLGRHNFRKCRAYAHRACGSVSGFQLNRTLIETRVYGVMQCGR